MNSDVGWHFSAEIGDWVGRVRIMDDVDVGRGSYIDIVLSIDPVAMVPFWDVEMDRIDLSDGPAWTSAFVRNRRQRRDCIANPWVRERGQPRSLSQQAAAFCAKDHSP